MYKFATKRENYEDYASGSVLYRRAGATNFPVRLASEIFQRCAHFLDTSGHTGPFGLYDPLCGVAYSLTVLGLLHGERIKCVVGSDADANVLDVARRNLALLSEGGLKHRVASLKVIAAESERKSHAVAVESAIRLAGRRTGLPDIETAVFQSDALSPQTTHPLLDKIDMVIVDLPYGGLTHWQKDDGDDVPVSLLLETLKERLPQVGVVAIVSDKGQKPVYSGYRKVNRFQLGKRRVLLLEPDERGISS